MKGFGVFSPCSATSRYVLAASGLHESSCNTTPREDTQPLSLNLLDFKVTEKSDSNSDFFTNSFENTNFNQFAPETPFSFTNTSFGGSNFDDYVSSRSTAGIAEFSLLHSMPVDLNTHLTTMKWIKLGVPYTDDKGLIVVGSSSGDVFFYDSAALTESKTLLQTYTTNVCSSPIKCLAYGGKNKLGVAGLYGQVYSLDLSDPSNYASTDVSYGKWKVGQVTSLSWNHRLPHILASAGSALNPADTSNVVVWDLNVNRPASVFRDPVGRVNPVALDWVPDQATYLVVAYGDDNAPSVQLWDLRNTSAPLFELNAHTDVKSHTDSRGHGDVKAHTRGLTDLKFSPHDPSVLLTSSKDDTTKCWHLTPERTFTLLSTFQTEALSHHSRVEWHPNSPGLFLSQANDGQLNVHDLYSGTVEGSYLPVWTRKRGGITSGFAGQVTSWNNVELNNFTLTSQLDNDSVKMLDSVLEVMGMLSDENMFTEFCESKANSSASEYEKLTWSVLKCQYKGQLKDLLSTLGYSNFEPATNLLPTESVNSNVTNSLNLPTQLGGNLGNQSLSNRGSYFTNRTNSLSEVASQDDKDAEDFFNSLTLNNNLLDPNSNLLDPNAGLLNPNSGLMNPNNLLDLNTESNVTSVNMGLGGLDWCSDKKLKNKLVNADFKEAAKRCLDLNKVVEGLLLAYVGGQEVFLELVEKVVESKKDPFLNLLHLLMQGDVETVLLHSNLKDWKETLCILYTYGGDLTLFRTLSHKFAKRLFEQGFYQEATIAYILACDYFQVANLWKLQQSLSSTKAGLDGGRLEERVEMMLKLSVLSFSMWSNTTAGYQNDSFDSVLMELSEVFIDAGMLDKALETLNVTGASNSEQLRQMKSKIENQLATKHSPQYSVQQPVQPVQSVVQQAYGAQPLVQPGVQQTPYGTQPVVQPGLQHPATSTVPNAVHSVGQPTPYTTQSSVHGVGSGLTTAPVANLSQSMTNTTTRTVPLTALQPTSHYPAQATNYPGSTAVPGVAQSYATANSVSGSTAVSSVSTGFLSSQYPSNTSSTNLSSYNSLPHSTNLNTTHTNLNPTHTNLNPAHANLNAVPSHLNTSLNTNLNTSLTAKVGSGVANMSQTSRPGYNSNVSNPVHPLTSRPQSYSMGPSAQNYSVGTAAPSYSRGGSGQSFSMGSSAPGAVAGAVKPGMPVPWPNPTATQQLSSKTVATQESNKLIIASTQNVPKGEMMPKADLDLVVSTLNSLTAKLGDSKMDLESKQSVNDLVGMLKQGSLSAEANSLLATLCRAVSQDDYYNANLILTNIISKIWDNQNKPWILCLKRLIPK